MCSTDEKGPSKRCASMSGILWDDACWTRVATADVEEADGQFRKCEIYAHSSGGGYCLFFGAVEYEGMGKNQSCGTYSYEGGVLKDSDGDIIPIRNVERDRDEESSSGGNDRDDKDDDEDYVPAGRQQSRRVRGMGIEGAGRGKGNTHMNNGYLCDARSRP